MVMFHKTEIDLGKIKVGSQNIFEFPYENVDYISRVVSPCVCTDVTNYVKEKIIRSKYIPKPIPIHLNVIEFPVEYTIKIEYMKNNVQYNVNLVFKAIITE